VSKTVEPFIGRGFSDDSNFHWRGARLTGKGSGIASGRSFGFVGMSL